MNTAVVLTYACTSIVTIISWFAGLWWVLYRIDKRTRKYDTDLSSSNNIKTEANEHDNTTP